MKVSFFEILIRILCGMSPVQACSIIIAIITLAISCFYKAYENVYNTNPDDKWRMHDTVILLSSFTIVIQFFVAIYEFNA